MSHLAACLILLVAAAAVTAGGKLPPIDVFGSGEGIQLRHGEHRGRLVMPSGGFEGGKKLYALLSDDHGRTWRPGDPQVQHVPQVAEGRGHAAGLRA